MATYITFDMVRLQVIQFRKVVFLNPFGCIVGDLTCVRTIDGSAWKKRLVQISAELLHLRRAIVIYKISIAMPAIMG